MTITEKCQSIKCIISDVDGVMTDGKIIYDSLGNEIKAFCVKDGLIISILQRLGFKVGIITGRNSPIVIRRAQELSLDFHIHGSKNKIEAYEQIKEQFGIQDKEIAYIGDDLNDLDVLRVCGLSACPLDAVPYIKEQVNWISSNKGGEGAFREFADFILSEQKLWTKILD